MQIKAEQVLKIGVVGCGNMGRKHATNCYRTKGVSVVAVADVDTARAAALAAEVGGAAVYPGGEAMLADMPLDAVIVATPPGVRWEVVQAAAALGTAVFVEKPIALDLSTAKACCVAVKEASVVNAVGFQLRYSPLTQRARTITSGQPVTHVRTICTTPYYLMMDMPLWYLQREHSGGPLLEQSIHMFDAARYLVGEIAHVFARGDRQARPDLDLVDSEDRLVLTYRFANGALGTHIDSCAMLQFNWEVELFGPNWRLVVDYARNRLHGHIGEETIENKMPHNDLHVLEMQTFLAAVRRPERNGVLSDFDEATKTLALMLAGDRSLRTGAWEPVRE
ncbi:Gfo/Idh/MocA family oxidoreductase [Dehalococcoidia bacterium]|nr:Gfo/Idh/MocA family oxidoreductase [Dehalococcoidia bacterium]